MKRFRVIKRFWKRHRQRVEILQKELEQILEKNQILRHEPLLRHTTFGVGGPADFYLMPKAAQIPEVMHILIKRQIPAVIIGNGSNLLVGDKGIRGAVIEIGRQMSGVTAEGEYVIAQGGTLLSKTAQEAAKRGLSGLEFAAGIPGSVGGAMVMNAGAYDGEMKDITAYVEVLDRDGQIRRLTNAQMEFSYRNSCIAKNGYIVLKAAFKLKSSSREGIFSRMEELKERRREKQPLEYQSAGSTFKRPQGYFAGKMIMDAGLSGFSVGGAKVSEKHCGFVINSGGATAADVLSVIRHVQKRVKEQFGVELQPEVKILGEF